jgi:YebC/PmpR family DNA-binding regulatory protein
VGRKWNNIKMKKGQQDKLRSQNYTKVLREVTMAVKKSGSADPDSNFALKIALLKSRENNVPRDNVEKAIKKGLGDGTENYEEVNYEGYGVDGVAIFVEAATDNVTRTIANVRSYFNRWGGSVGKEGCLQFVFERKAVFEIKDEAKKIDVDDLTMNLIDYGVEDVERDEDYVTVKAPVESFGDVHRKLEDMKIKVEESALERLPLNTKDVSKDSYDKIMKLIEALDADDDVQKVYHNLEWNESYES